MLRKLAALIGLISLLTPLARGAIIIHISPHPENDQYVLIQASGTSGNVTENHGSGTLVLDRNAFVYGITSTSPGLTIGGEAITFASPTSYNSIGFSVSNDLPLGELSFAGDGLIGQLAAPYLNTFIPGTYEIVSGSSSMFGMDVTGTLTIHTSPVPEPSTWALLSGLFVFGWVVRRRVARRSAK